MCGNEQSDLSANKFQNVAIYYEHWRQTMIWTIFIILLILWLLGFSLHVGGGLIHLLLVVAVVVMIFNLITKRRMT